MEPDFLAIVDPWVTTLSFVVALAMGIQGSGPLAHFHPLYHFGDVTRALTIRAIAMTLLLFIVVGLAVMALSTTSVNYYLMVAVSVFVVWRWAWDCPPRKAEAWNSFSINKQTVGLLSFLLSSSWSVFWELEFLVAHGIMVYSNM